MIEKISSPADLKQLTDDEALALCGEIREKLLDTVSKTGGHLASNLGVVELTVALHRVFDSPDDKIIFDVGHQSYVHKMLTGRYGQMDTLRSFGGLSGFTKRDESEHDPFGCGHASTSLSAAVGIAAANKLSGKQDHVIAVVGDGAFTGGMIYEALNNCEDKTRLIVVLNQNEMSISPNVGGISSYFSRFRSSVRYFRFKNGTKQFFGRIPVVGGACIAVGRLIRNAAKRVLMRENLFELMGLSYYGPIDGNNMRDLETILGEAKNDGRCSVVHICTKKGKGYAPAEENPDLFHGVGKFDVESGRIAEKDGKTLSQAFGEALTAAAEADDRVCAVTAAMTDGTGLCGFAQKFPDRLFDVGIAEEHAATFAAGLATQGYKPVFAVYSTFAQRSFDQIIHDIALQKLPVVLALDRAGFVNSDGPTHHGLFDVSMLLTVPDMHIYSVESYDDMNYALSQALSCGGPAAIRYAKGVPADYDRAIFKDIKGMSFRDFGRDPRVAVITYGRLTYNVLLAALDAFQSGVSVRVIRLTDLWPINIEKLRLLTHGVSAVYFAEEGIRSGGLSQVMLDRMLENGLLDGKKVHIDAVDGIFVPHGHDDRLYEYCGLDRASLTRRITELSQ